MFKRNLKWQIKSTTNFIFFHRCSPRDKPFYSPIDLVHIQANIYMTIVTNGILMSCCPSCFTLLIPGWCEPWTGTCTLISQVCAGVCVCSVSHLCSHSRVPVCADAGGHLYVEYRTIQLIFLRFYPPCLSALCLEIGSLICPARIKLRSFCLQGKHLLQRATIPVLPQHFSRCCCFVDLV